MPTSGVRGNSIYKSVLSSLARIWVAEKRIENGGRTFDKGKVGMLIIVFRLAENTKGETDFIRGEV